MKEISLFISKLLEIKNDYLGSGNYKEAVELLNELNVVSVSNALIYNKVDNSEDNISIMKLLIEILNDVYNNSGIESPVPDEVYDKLYKRYLDDSGENIIGSPVVNVEESKSHKYPNLRGTLDKIHFITEEDRGSDNRKSLEAWIKSTENKLGRRINPDIELDIKWDGVSGIFECDNLGYIEDVLSRGYTKDNTAKSLKKFFDRNTNFNHLLIEGYKGKYGVKTEIVITDEDYKKACKIYPFTNKRSCVSGILGNKEPDPKLSSLLTIIPLRVELFDSKYVFKPVYAYEEFPYKVCKLKDFTKIKEYINNLAEYAERMGIDADGVVIKIDDPEIEKELGREDNINKFEVAYKFPAVEKKSVLKFIDFQIGTLGNISPVAKIEPVKMKGNTIRSISLGSIDRFEDMQLAEGDEVIIKYDVIPYLYINEGCEKSGEEPIPTPKRCPVCNELLKRDPMLKCVNDNCDARIVGKIVNYLNKRNILNISEATVTTLVNKGYLKDISDLYEIKNKRHSIAEIPGLGEASVNTIINSIESRVEMYDYEFLGSIGIESIGERMFKKILEFYTIDELIDLVLSGKTYKLEDIRGIKEATVMKITRGILNNIELISKLRYKLVINRDKRTDQCKVCFTKIRDKEFQEYLENNNIKVENNFNKTINYLIVEDYEVKSSKVDKANKQGIKVLSLKDAYEHFGYKG